MIWTASGLSVAMPSRTADALTALEKSEHAANPHVAKFISFIRASERGITK